MPDHPSIPAAKVPMPLAKRAFDLLFAGGLLALSAPIFLLVLAGIWLEQRLAGHQRAPLFYTEARVSQGRPFNFRKFNIFKPGVIEGMRRRGQFIHTKLLERDGHSMSLMGRILQRTYLDELPQLLSIISGDMTVVGPRPRNLEVYEEGLAKGETFRSSLKAGLTGVVQANKGQPGMGMAQQADMDWEYLEYQLGHGAWQRFRRDMSLVLRTLLVMAKARGL